MKKSYFNKRKGASFEGLAYATIIGSALLLLALWTNLTDNHSSTSTTENTGFKLEQGEYTATKEGYRLAANDTEIIISPSIAEASTTLTIKAGTNTQLTLNEEKQLIYEAVYDQIDLVVYEKGKDIAYDFELAPKADVADIQLQVEEDAIITNNGDLHIPVPGGTLIHSAPVSYQEINGERVEVESAFTLTEGVLGFELGDYNADYALVIDPTITFEMMMAPTFVEDANASSDANSLTVNLPTGTMADDVMIATVVIDGFDLATVTAPSGWTQIDQGNAQGDVAAVATFWKTATASEPANFTFSWGTNTNGIGVIATFRGVDTTNPINAQAASTGSSNMPNTPDALTTINDALLLRIYGQDQDA
ncbi:MAG: hypothetical protein AAF847_08865, partial [Bacteroidota bacterium]